VTGASGASCQTPGVAATLLIAVGYLALAVGFFWGSFGVVRGAFRAAAGHDWPPRLRYPFVAAAGIVALFGGWLVYMLSRPFIQFVHTRRPERNSLDWTWVPAVGWPALEPGFLPSQDWSPPSAWPPAPPDHVFWQRTRRGRRRRRLLVTAAVSTVLVVAGCVAAAVTTGPCAFDPPPGDQLAVRVTNDTPVPVAVVDCLDERCASAQSRLLIAPAAHVSMPLEGCAGGTMGIVDPSTGRLRNCIAEPTEDENFNLADVAISAGRTCRGMTEEPVRIAPDG
jgi:hypothetical protein